MLFFAIAANLLILVHCSNGGREMCAGLDISNEPDLSIERMRGIWYAHFTKYTTPFGRQLPFDAKMVFIPVPQNTFIKFFFGRQFSGSGCLATTFVETQRRPGSVCLLARQTSPQFLDTFEVVYTILPGADKLVVAICDNPPACTGVILVGLTRRRTLCRGEREMFNRKLRQLGTWVQFETPDQPTASGCTVPGGLETKMEPKRIQRCGRHRRY